MKSQTIWDRARADLCITTKQGETGLLLWDHSARVARVAERIASLSEVQAASPDVPATVAAALYHDAGWVSSLRKSEATWADVLQKPPLDSHLEQGAAMMRRSLSEFLSVDSLSRAAHAIQSQDDRDVDSIEAQILVDADNLDEFGVVALWSTIRRGVAAGKGVQSVIDTWRRRKEYRYWDARLKDSFRFAAVRAVAQQRLDKFEYLMGQLEEQHQGEDLFLAASTNSSTPPSNPARARAAQ